MEDNNFNDQSEQVNLSSDPTDKPDKTVNFNLSPKKKKAFKIALIIFATALVIVVIYMIGYKVGFKKGEEKAKKDLRPNVSELFNNIPNVFNSVQGKVTEISDKQITVQTDKDGKKTIELNDKVKVNKKEQQLSIGDVKKDQKVIVYSTKKDNKVTATRIVIRD